MFGRKRREKEHRHRKRKLLWGLILVVVLFMAAIYGASYYLSPQDKLESADAIVVVSGGQTLSRAQRGIELYQQGRAPKLIFSGAALDDGPSNARQMHDEARRRGVPERDIITDERSTTTYQNATETKPLIEELNAHRVYLVTSPYHQRRVLLTFRKVYGGDYQFLNQSSYDNRWSKAAWWASPFGVWITLSELSKVGYIYISQHYE